MNEFHVSVQCRKWSPRAKMISKNGPQRSRLELGHCVKFMIITTIKTIKLQINAKEEISEKSFKTLFIQWNTSKRVVQLLSSIPGGMLPIACGLYGEAPP